MKDKSSLNNVSSFKSSQNGFKHFFTNNFEQPLGPI